MGIGSRIKEARERLGLTQVELGRIVGVTGSSITNYENNTSHPKEAILYKLLDALHVDANYLFQDEMSDVKSNILSAAEQKHIDKYRLLDDRGKSVVDGVLDIEYKYIEELRTPKVQDNDNKIIKFERPSIPDYDVPTSAGPGQFLDVSSYKMVTLGKDDPQDASFIVTVKGHSMEPLYRDGDKVFVRQQPGVEVGEIGLFMVDNETYIKEMGYGELISQNPKYPNIKLRDGVSAYCFGKIVGVKKQKPIAMVAAYDSEIKGVHAFESPVTEEELERILEEYNKKIGDTHMDEFD